MSLQLFLAKASQMPEFPHSVEGQEYDVENSEVARWLMAQPEAKEMVMQLARLHKAITFEPISKRWKGTGIIPSLGFSEEEIVEALGQKFMKSGDLLAKCSIAYKKEMGMWGWNMALKKLLAKGLVLQDEKGRYAVAR